MPSRDYMVTVCDACLCASCWHGEFLCEESYNAGTVDKRKSELNRLKREHRHHYGVKKLKEVYGDGPTYLTEGEA